ncbi:MAG: glycosyltransferase family 4 protein, partial [Nitrospira sp.]|nr:glycosyltransferase family 4 protein [Nitrospira sp.]
YGLLLGLLSIFGVGGRKIFAPIHRPNASMSSFRRWLYRLLCRRLDVIFATSEYVREGWMAYCKKDLSRVLYPGVIKDMGADFVSGERRSVLFWRNANRENGADIACTAVKNLAGRMKDIDFVFAVRPSDELEAKLLELEREFSNVYVHLYPYSDGVTLQELLNRSLFVLAPFRYLSMNPQMAILETLYAGVPVVASDVESNSELVVNGETGIVFASKEASVLEDIIENLLKDRAYLMKLQKNARPLTAKKWNWRDYQEGLIAIVEG